MILYSIVPTEIVFSRSSNPDEPSFIEMDYMGEKVQVMPVSNNRYIINRLISTSPKAFLNPRLQPGTIITASI